MTDEEIEDKIHADGCAVFAVSVAVAVMLSVTAVLCILRWIGKI